MLAKEITSESIVVFKILKWMEAEPVYVNLHSVILKLQKDRVVRETNV